MRGLKNKNYARVRIKSTSIKKNKTKIGLFFLGEGEMVLALLERYARTPPFKSLSSQEDKIQTFSVTK